MKTKVIGPASQRLWHFCGSGGGDDNLTKVKTIYYGFERLVLKAGVKEKVTVSAKNILNS